MAEENLVSVVNCSEGLKSEELIHGGHGNESYRFASNARMPLKLPLKIFIILKKFHYSEKQII